MELIKSILAEELYVPTNLLEDSEDNKAMYSEYDLR